MAKRIICKNEDGVQVEFNYSFEPFFLVSVDGIYTVSNNVVTSEIPWWTVPRIREAPPNKETL